MPTPPKSGESEKEWMSRCMGVYKEEGDKPHEQRVAICLDMWRRKNEDITLKIDKLLGDEISTGDVATNTARGSIDVVGAKCPEGHKWCEKRKVCIKISNEASVWAEKGSKAMWIPDTPKSIKKYKDKGWKISKKSKTNESANNPKPGDRFIYNKFRGKKAGKKLTIKHVGSGIGNDKYIDVKFDDERYKRSIKMTDFFKGDQFKYIGESTVIGGTYGNANTNIAGSGQTRVVGSRDGEITVLERTPRPLKFNRLFGAYLPALKTDDELEEGFKRIDIPSRPKGKTLGFTGAMKKYGVPKKKVEKGTQMQCIECGKRFKKKIGPRTFEVKCPKCGSYDTEPF